MSTIRKLFALLCLKYFFAKKKFSYQYLTDLNNFHSHSNKVHKVLILDIISTADDENYRILECCAIFWCQIASFQQLSIKIKIVVDVGIASAFHQLISNLRDGEVLKDFLLCHKK